MVSFTAGRQARISANACAVALSATLVIACAPCWAQADDSMILPAAPADARTLVWTGYKQLQAGEYEAAFETLTTSVRLNPIDPDSRKFLGHTLMKMGYVAKAIECFEAAIKLGACTKADKLALAKAYYTIGEYRRSLAIYSRIMKKDPTCADATEGLARVYTALGHRPFAEETCLHGLRYAKDPTTRRRFVRLMREFQERIAASTSIDS